MGSEWGTLNCGLSNRGHPALGSLQYNLLIDHARSVDGECEREMKRLITFFFLSVSFCAAQVGDLGILRRPGRAGTAPTFASVRCTASQVFTAGTSNNITIPACAVAGDLEVLFISSQNAPSAVPSGWSIMTSNFTSPAAFITGGTIYKELTSSDISAGSVTLTTGSAGGIQTASVVFVGLPAGGTSSGEVTTFLSTSTTSTTISSPASVGVVAGDTVFYFGSNNGTGTITSSRGSSLQSPACGGGLCSSLYSEQVHSSSVGLTTTFTYAGYSTQGAFNAVVVVHGGTVTTPEAIPGLELWVSADCITRTATTCSTPSSGSTINSSGWVNRYGVANYNNTSITGTCTYNANQINGLPAVSFSSCAFNLGSTPSNGITPTVFSAAAVWANASTSAKGTLIGSGAGGPAYWTCASSKQQGIDKQGISQEGSGTAACDTSWHQANGIGINSAFPLFRIGEATDTTINGTTGSFTGPATVIGRNNLASPGEYLNGNLAELVYYSTQLTSAQITILETYFHNRYGL